MVTLHLLALLLAGPQDPVAPGAGKPLVFLDCAACDLDFVYDEIAFVSFVRDRESGEVHVLVTGQRTASGGREYTIGFIGQGKRARHDQTLVVSTAPNDTEAEIRAALVQTLRLGLLRYVAGTPLGRAIRVEMLDAPDPRRPPPAADRWNSWVFAVRGEAALEREESSGEMQLEASAGADRITADWKLTTGVGISYSGEHFELGEDDVQSVRRERNGRLLLVKSLGRRLSAGARAVVGSSTFENTALAVRVAPAIEFNVFPYDESTRRELRILYALGPRYTRYVEESVFGRLREARTAHEISATLDRVEPWGSARARLEWSQYLDDLSKNRLEATFEMSLRLGRGLALVAEVEGSRIRDQLSLPARGASPEEILLRQRQLASGYEVELAFGLTYRFGSMFSSIVNPRFGN